MKARILMMLVTALLLGCSKSVSYQAGQAMADRTYGAMAPEQMTAQVDSILRQVKSELEMAVDKRDWWAGFCDRGEEIWLERIDQINTAMRMKVYNPATIEAMFDQMRSSFRE